MKAKIKVGNIELEFEYETVDELCEVYDYITQEPVVENKEEDSLEDVAERIRKAIKEAETGGTYIKPNKYPQFPYDNPFRYWWNINDSYNPFPNKVTAGDK